MSKERKIIPESKGSESKRQPRSSREVRSGSYIGDHKAKGKVPPVSPSNRKK